MQTSQRTAQPGAVLILKLITAVWAGLGGLALLAIVAVTTVNSGFFALDRVASLFGGNMRGLPGYEDFVLLVIGGTALSFFPYCQLKGQHISVTLFSTRFPAWLNRSLDQAWLVLAVVAAIFLAYWMAAGLVERYEDRAISRVLGWPEWPFLLPGIVSLVLWAIVAAAQLIAPRMFVESARVEGLH